MAAWHRRTVGDRLMPGTEVPARRRAEQCLRNRLGFRQHGRRLSGVRCDGKFEVVGVIEVDKVQSAFLSILRSGQKLSKIVDVRAKLIDCDGAATLVFYVPEAHRRDKPVYLNGDLRKSFVRRETGLPFTGRLLGDCCGTS